LFDAVIPTLLKETIDYGDGLKIELFELLPFYKSIFARQIRCL